MQAPKFEVCTTFEANKLRSFETRSKKQKFWPFCTQNLKHKKCFHSNQYPKRCRHPSLRSLPNLKQIGKELLKQEPKSWNFDLFALKLTMRKNGNFWRARKMKGVGWPLLPSKYSPFINFWVRNVVICNNIFLQWWELLGRKLPKATKRLVPGRFSGQK